MRMNQMMMMLRYMGTVTDNTMILRYSRKSTIRLKSSEKLRKRLKTTNIVIAKVRVIKVMEKIKKWGMKHYSPQSVTLSYFK
jgi:hypothetical protein